jgi:hypothetical protein
MISGLDIYRAAKRLIDERGDEAALCTTGRAGLLFIGRAAHVGRS